MSDATIPAPVSAGQRPGGLARLIASRRFQKWAARAPVLRRLARREGEALMDIVSGFAQTQILCGVVELGILDRLIDGPESTERLSHASGVPPERLRVLMQGAAAIGLVKGKGQDRYALTARGAALLGVPGLADMIRHNRILYRDLEDPAAFFRDGADTELAAFWPYVFGAGAASDPETARRYSTLMADSQALVAEETLAAVSLSGRRHLLDVGGGTGVFLSEALRATPDLRGTLLDLPEVVPQAASHFAEIGLGSRTNIVASSFRDDPLPEGADTISLVRVLYDHTDDTVRALLEKCHRALPDGGRIIVSEPMSGGRRPDRATDTYFALYTLAMGTGRTRSPGEVMDLLHDAGFSGARHRATNRPFITSVVIADRT